jgi:outer membrane protein assembly factor BamB
LDRASASGAEGRGFESRRAHLRKILLLLSLSGIAACDHPANVSLIVPKAGSFALANACGDVVESASGGIYTFAQRSTLTVQVDSRAADGTVLWSKVLPSAAGRCTGAVTSSGNFLVVASDTVFSLASGTGAIKWRFAASDAVLATSSTGKVVVSTRAFSNTSAMLYGLSESDGSVLWSRAVDNLGAPFVDDGRSVVYYVRRSGALAVDLTTGAVKWETPLGQDLTLYAALASDGSILIGRVNDFSSEITAFGTDGTLRWRNATLSPRQLTGSPVIDDAGTVYSSAWDTQYGAGVYAFSVTSGSTAWKHDFDRIESNVAVDANHTVYVIARATADSAFELYGLRDGAIVSAVPAPGVDIGSVPRITIHSNKLLYYAAASTVVFIPTAGVSANAAWPVDKHDARRSARRQ